jgi:hypothetical protein
MKALGNVACWAALVACTSACSPEEEAGGDPKLHESENDGARADGESGGEGDGASEGAPVPDGSESGVVDSDAVDTGALDTGSALDTGGTTTAGKETFAFPTTGTDTWTLKYPPNFVTAPDTIEGTRATKVATVTRLTFTIVAKNWITTCAVVSFPVSVNGIVLGEFAFAVTSSTTMGKVVKVSNTWDVKVTPLGGKDLHFKYGAVKSDGVWCNGIVFESGMSTVTVEG